MERAVGTFGPKATASITNAAAKTVTAIFSNTQEALATTYDGNYAHWFHREYFEM